MPEPTTSPPFPLKSSSPGPFHFGLTIPSFGHSKSRSSSGRKYPPSFITP
jgi:hypothetical protein